MNRYVVEQDRLSGNWKVVDTRDDSVDSYSDNVSACAVANKLNNARGEFSSETMERMQKEELIEGRDRTATEIEARYGEINNELRKFIAYAFEPFINNLIKIVERHKK